MIYFKHDPNRKEIAMSIELTVKKKNRLRVLMAEEGIKSLKVLSEESGISEHTLYLFEKGKTRLTDDNICRLLWTFQCKFEDLIQYDIESNGNSSGPLALT